jgi:D-aminopeptidase
LGIVVGELSTGPLNAITDVVGVRVGHQTLSEGESIRTGVTAVLPHDGNLYQQKAPAAIYLGNAHGKLAGYTQVRELGTIETPIVLTNTLSVSAGIEALIRHTLEMPGNEAVTSVNAVVGETNDAYLNDIRALRVTADDVKAAILSAKTGPVEEGSVGAGTGTTCFGYKGGIGTASRQLSKQQGGYTVGVLVQANYGGVLTINGVPVGRELAKTKTDTDDNSAGGSCMIVVATDAPLCPRNLARLAKRTMLGLGRTGSHLANGSGDYAIAFSTAYRIPADEKLLNPPVALVSNRAMTPLFQAAVEATEESVHNAMFMATTVTGVNGHTRHAIPLDRVAAICQRHGAISI